MVVLAVVADALTDSGSSYDSYSGGGGE